MIYAVLLLAAMAGQIIQTTTGFGFAVVIMAVCSSFFDVPILASICPLLSLFSSAYLTLHYRRDLKFSHIAWPLAAYVVTNFLSVRLNNVLDTDALKGYLGVVLVLISIFFLYLREKLHIQKKPRNGLIAGGLSGFLAGLFGTSGPPMSVYMVSSTSKKEEYLVSMQSFFLCSNAVNILFRSINGFYTLSVFRLALLALFGMVSGLLIGRKIADRINIRLLRTLTYVFIGLSGLWLAVKAFLL